MHRLADQTKFRHRTHVLDKAGVRRAACRGHLWRLAGFRCNRFGKHGRKGFRFGDETFPGNPEICLDPHTGSGRRFGRFLKQPKRQFFRRMGVIEPDVAGRRRLCRDDIVRWIADVDSGQGER